MILGIHIPAEYYGWYHHGYGVDIVEHLMGGLLGATATLWLIRKKEWTGSPGLILFAMIGGTALLAFVWELYEYGRLESPTELLRLCQQQSGQLE